MKCKILKTINGQIWNQHLLLSKSSTFFQTYEYLFTQHHGNKFPIFIYVLDDNEKIKAQLGVIVQKSPMVYSTKILKSISKIFSIFGNRISWTGGPIIHTQDNHERNEILKLILQGLDKISKENNVFMIDGYTNPLDIKIDEDYKRIFSDNGYSKIDFVTYIIDLSKNDTDIWDGLNKSAKRDVARAKKDQITVKELEQKDLVAFWKLAKIWGKTKGIETSDDTSLMKHYWEYYQKGVEKVFLAYENNEIISSHRIGVFNHITYSHSLVNSYKKRGSVGGPYLTWYGIQWAKQMGMKMYDFSGGQMPSNQNNDEQYEKQWSSLLAYKAKWGGKELPYFHFVKIQKKNNYNMMRILLKIDWFVRNYKKNRFSRGN